MLGVPQRGNDEDVDMTVEGISVLGIEEGQLEAGVETRYWRKLLTHKAATERERTPIL